MLSCQDPDKLTFVARAINDILPGTVTHDSLVKIALHIDQECFAMFKARIEQRESALCEAMSALEAITVPEYGTMSDADWLSAVNDKIFTAHVDCLESTMSEIRLDAEKLQSEPVELARNFAKADVTLRASLRIVTMRGIVRTLRAKGGKEIKAGLIKDFQEKALELSIELPESLLLKMQATQ